MRLSKHGIGGIALTLFIAACAPMQTAGPEAATGRMVYGTDGTNLVSFGSRNPANSVRAKAVTGLQGGERLIGLDFRPKDGKLYGVGDTSRIYLLDAATGAATPVADGAFNPGLAARGAAGVDFNPVPDKLRVHTGSGQNLRLDPDKNTTLDGDANADGVQPDGALRYAQGQPNAGQTANLTATAYTNSVAGATSTTLFALDAALDTLVTLPSPNNGMVTAVAPLGVDITEASSFDISPDNNDALITYAPASGPSTLAWLRLDGPATGSRLQTLGTVGWNAPLVGIAIAP